jgi:cellulose synthase/poly-beta-1,6-N-acetylglucosamine synthase-like glycosyltransferase
MNSTLSMIVESLVFVSLYIQVFLIITLFEHRDRQKRAIAAGSDVKAEQPTVSVIVPCYNEEATVIGTIDSLKKLNYPAKKLSIIAIDDGSTDDTWSYLKRYENDPQVSIYHKENGGKHTAVNLGIEKSASDIVGCLDADSFVHPEALNRMLPMFADPLVMAVTPAVIVRSPGNVLERFQHAEYNIGVFLRKMYSTFNGIHVTPGPFSMFRRSVFTEVGLFRSAYNTEDLEMALRLHRHDMKIENAEHAYVYTTPPSTVRALVKQRVRWNTGFLLNIRDYRDLFFNARHGHVGTFTLPAGLITLIMAMFLSGYSLASAATATTGRIVAWRLVGWSWHWPSWHWFFVDTSTLRLLILIMFAIGITFMFLGKRIASGSWKPSRDMLYCLVLYTLIAPIWIAISWYRAATARVGSWR